MVKYIYYFSCIFLIFWINQSNLIEAAPGIAGDDWTDEEVQLVKEKLWTVMKHPDRFVKVSADGMVQCTHIIQMILHYDLSLF